MEALIDRPQQLLHLFDILNHEKHYKNVLTKRADNQHMIHSNSILWNKIQVGFKQCIQNQKQKIKTQKKKEDSTASVRNSGNEI